MTTANKRVGKPTIIKKHAKENNVWLNTHKLLDDETKIDMIEKVMAACQWSQATVYRRMKNHGNLREFEKKAIANVYKKRVDTFFPSTELALA